MTTTLSPELLADLKAKMAAATSLPWAWDKSFSFLHGPHSARVVGSADYEGYWFENGEADQAYIAAACNAVPALLAEIERRDQGGVVAWPDRDAIRAKAVRSRGKLATDDADRHAFAFEVAEAIIGNWIVKGDKRGNRDLMIQAVDLALSLAAAPPASAPDLGEVVEALKSSDRALANVTAFEDDARYIMGNTNFEIVKHEREQVRALLAKIEGSAG